MDIVKPPHSKYLLHDVVNYSTYVKYYRGYQTAKKMLTANGIATIGYEVAKGQIIYWGRILDSSSNYANFHKCHSSHQSSTFCTPNIL